MLLKKFFLGALVLIGMSSYTELSNEYRMDPTGSDQDNDEVVTVLHTNTRTAVTVTLCPGTGVDCVIDYTAGDGDPAQYKSKKGKGQPDIQF